MLEEPINKAIGFLINSRNDSKVWSDFHLPTGESDGWVTGYVGFIMAATANFSAMAAAREAWVVHGPKHFFKGHGGWSFNRWSPEDADSTAWSIRMGLMLGLAGKLRITIAEDFLRRHIAPDGGIATFINEEEVRRFVDAGPDDRVSGWMTTHPCVTAAAANVPALRDSLIPYLISRQHPDGSWEAYWWNDQAFTVSLAVSALLGEEKHLTHIRKAASWAGGLFAEKDHVSNARFENGSPFATALALKTMAMASGRHGLDEKANAALRWLMSQQNDDGSWAPSAVMQVPPVYMVVPENSGEWNKGTTGPRFGAMVVDRHAIFTTATVLDCLSYIWKF